MNQALEAKLAIIPHDPGCYLFKDQSNTIIYVGKAKDLKKRVSQYFQRPHEGRTQKLVNSIVDFDVIVTLNEKEALLLEIDLIKKHRPYYNILFMDDKSYPMIKITNEKFPKVLVVRDRKKDKKANYFGPYPDARAAREVHRLIHELFPIRKCAKLPSKVCLYYHIHQCDGPCEQLIDEHSYNQYIEQIISLLKGQGQSIIKEYQDKMKQAADNLDYEGAAMYRDNVTSIQYISEKQSGVRMDQQQDMVHFDIEHGAVSLVHFIIKEGKLFEKNAKVFTIIDDAIEEITSAILLFYTNHPKPKQLFVPETIDSALLSEILNIEVSTPVRGFKKDLMATVFDNAKTHLSMHDAPNIATFTHEKAYEQLSQLLQVEAIHQLEMVDVSHISGSFSVGAMVVHKDGLFDKSSYRKYLLHQRNDDVASMSEMVYRRMVRALKENKAISDVIVVDGGITQVNAVVKVLRSLNITTPLIGLSKDKFHKTTNIVLENGDQIPLLANDPLVHLLSSLQEEVHRFVINYHRQLRNKAQTASILDEIDGIGPIRRKQLLKHFKSFKAIKEASLSQLCEVLPEHIATNVIQFFSDK